MTDIVDKDLSYVVNGCIFDVHNEVGPGVREECYQKALELRLRERGISFVSKPYTRRKLIYLGEVATVFEPDLVIAGRLITELKVQKEGLTTANFRQLVNYLKFWQQPLGLLVNFAAQRAVIQRVVFHEACVESEEDYSYIEPLVTEELRPLHGTVRQALLDIHHRFGLGYGDATYRKLLGIAVHDHGLCCEGDQIVVPQFHAVPLPSSPITPQNIEDRILVEIEAVQDHITARAIRTMQTHLGMTGARFGLVVNFGKSRFEIKGIRPLGTR